MRQHLLRSLIPILSAALIAVPAGGAQSRTPNAQNPSTQQNPSTRQDDQKGTNNRPATTRDQSTLRSANDKLTEQSFVQQAYEANQNEVKVAQLAKTRASSANVKSYAQQLETDHTKALTTLRRQATASHITIPTDTASSTSTNRSTTDTQSARSTTNNSSSKQGNDVPTAMARTADSPNMQELSGKSGAEFDKAFIDMMVEDHQKAISLFEQANTEKFADAGLRKFISDQLPGLRAHLARAQQLQKGLGPNTTTNTTKPNNR